MSNGNSLSEFPRLVTTKVQLGQVLTKAVDLYRDMQISESELQKYISALKKNSGTLLLPDAQSTELDRGIVKIIGKKRAMIVSAILANLT